ncbi:unnamed protein product [Larinioides sclopetarius]|uniref:Speckle-type POZ protein n=1 Tax=Larinioides sclopetarius TaxID=280406 RepID=A0AAV2BLR1_9ARAC
MAYSYDTNSGKNGFSFIWSLENFEYCWLKTGHLLKSPTFIVDTIERTKWSLDIYPRGKESARWISLYLCREMDSKGPATIEVDFDLAFLAFDGSVLTSAIEYKHAFSKDDSWGFPEFEERETVFAKRSMFLQQDSLMIRCKIWKIYGNVESGQCIARTRIGVEKKAFLWKIPNFSIFNHRQIFLNSTSDDEPVMALNMFPSKIRKIRGKRNIYIEFVPSKKDIVFSTFKSSCVDTKGECMDCGEFELWFSPTIQSEVRKLSLYNILMIRNDSLFLPNDVLTLCCELAFSTGIVLKGIEGTSYGCMAPFVSNNVISENTTTTIVEKPDSETSDIKVDLSSMLRDNILWNVKLCSESEIFYANWFILSARSPVFRAMFQNDMKEKATDQIDIEDLKPDTVRRMLLYMYTDSLEELQWEIAYDLYVAAEKYQITSLKYKCASFLKINLSLTNACEVLHLADLHQDKELKSTVQDFILENDKSISNSSEWELLMQANVILAAETMLLKFKE